MRAITVRDRDAGARQGRLKPIVGAIRTLPEAPAAFAPDRRLRGKTIIQVTGG